MTIYNFEDLRQHVGHKLVSIYYKEIDEVTIECETCHEILYSEWEYCPSCDKKMNEYGECSECE